MDSTGTKMVIVMRKDLGMRKGKMIAQGCHSVLKVFLDRKLVPCMGTLMVPLTEDMQQWIDNEFTKICVGVNSEQELLDVHRAAVEKGLPCSLIQDAGHTEFKEPTYTCCCLGPAKAESIDEITGELSLL